MTIRGFSFRRKDLSCYSFVVLVLGSSMAKILKQKSGGKTDKKNYKYIAPNNLRM